MAALTGPSGAGKSTFLNVMGLLERPTAGTIRIGGEDAGALDEAGLTRLRGRSIGFIFQFHHLLPAFTALENVMMPLLVDRGRRDAGDARARGGAARHGRPRRLPRPSRPASSPAGSSSGSRWRGRLR